MSSSPDPEKGQPKDSDQNIRRLSLVTLLLSRRGRPVSAAEIRVSAEGGYHSMTDEAFKKRFQEDRAELAELGIQIESETGDDGTDVYRLPRDAYYLTSVHLSLEEVTALAACLAVLDGTFAYSQPLRLALLSLAQDRPEILAAAEAPPLAVVAEKSELDSAILLPKLQAAVDDRKSVRFTYYTIGRDEELERTVDPYGLQLVAGEWYLIGRCHLRDEVRTFRLSRIHSRVVYASGRLHDFVRPTDFNLETYRDRPAWRLAAVRGTARVRVGPAMAWWVEAHWSHCGEVERQADGSIVYTTDYADPRELLSWVLNLADAAELLGPPELRTRLREQLGALAAALDAPAPGAEEVAASPSAEAPPPRRRKHAHDGHVEVDRFTRLSTLAMYILTSCGKDEADLDVDEVLAAVGMSRDQLETDVDLLNTVGYVGGGMVMYATFKGATLHVRCELEGPTLSRPARLSPLQADALLLAIDLVGGQLPSVSGSALESAGQKIREVRATPPTLAANDLFPGDADILDRVNAAVAGKRLLRIEYWKQGTEGFSERIVEPYLVIHERGEWFYICWCRSAQGRRMFRVATTRAAELLAETFTPRDDLELDLYRREGVPTSRTYAPKIATVWYSPLVTRWVEERQPVRRLADGACLAEQPYVEEGWLTQHLLPFADQARLLGPPEAVAHLRATVARLLAVYA